MNEWFPSSYAWIPGTVGGLLGGLWGSMVGIMSSRGKGRALVFASYWVLLLVGSASLVTGAAALILGQPLHVWLGLLIIGGVLPIVLLPQHAMLRRAYARFDQPDHGER